jgi:hypothetical protein
MNEMNRREFLASTAQVAGGVLAYSLLGEEAPAEGSATVDEPAEYPDEDFWVGGY